MFLTLEETPFFLAITPPPISFNPTQPLQIFLTLNFREWTHMICDVLWLSSLTWQMCSRLTHVVVCLIVRYPTFALAIVSGWESGCFCLLASMNKMLQTSCASIFGWGFRFLFPFGVYLGVEPLSHTVIPCLTSWDTADYVQELAKLLRRKSHKCLKFWDNHLFYVPFNVDWGYSAKSSLTVTYIIRSHRCATSVNMGWDK